MTTVDLDSIDTCEGGRFSMYITPNMKAMPCSFDQKEKYVFDISDKDINDAWNSKEFDDFRDKMRNSCQSCLKRTSCYGGCPLVKEIVICKEKGEPNENKM
jgi:radical SAM protein with 4Fe4S-binding SPASM domain